MYQAFRFVIYPLKDLPSRSDRDFHSGHPPWPWSLCGGYVCLPGFGGAEVGGEQRSIAAREAREGVAGKG